MHSLFKILEMTEQEYINVKDLGHITDAIGCLNNICPAISENIPTEEYSDVMDILREWQDYLFNKKCVND